MSYQPGMDMPIFYHSTVSADAQVQQYIHGLTHNRNRDTWGIRENELDLVELVATTPVLGQRHPAILNNAPSAKAPCFYPISNASGSKYHPAPLFQHELVRSLSTNSRNSGRGTNLSPNPWAMITVAVCLFKAGTTKGAAAMMIIRFDDEFDETRTDGKRS